MTVAVYFDRNLCCLSACRGVNLSLERGNGSSFAYVSFAMVAGAHFGDYQAAYRFGKLGYDLVEARGLKRFQAGTYMIFGNMIVPWTKHVRAGRDILRRAFEAANKNSDLTYAAYSCNQLDTNLLFAGDPLPEAQREAEHGLAFAQKAQFGAVIDFIAPQLQLMKSLRGFTSTFGSLDDDEFQELQLERRFSDNPLAECWYWIRKLQACFFAGDYAAAIEASSQAARLLHTSLSFPETAEYHLYAALARAASWDAASADQRRQHLAALAEHHRQHEVWAENGPENFENRAALVGAEIARIEGRDVDAMRLYERAIRSAEANGFIHNGALANELAARFYAARGFEKIARMHLEEARYNYLRWGANGKVRQLDHMYPYLRETAAAPGPTGAIAAPVEHLDLATVIKVSQAVSGEIVHEKLIDTLMRTAIEQAGAERGVLVLSLSSREPRIVAEATTSGDTVSVHLRDEPVTTVALPESVLRHVARTNETVILDDAAANSEFAEDPYIRERHARSVLCLPLLNQGRLNGLLYLENNLARDVFAPARITVLKLLASQAAISLENAHLYRDLVEREAKIRRLVDANIIGIFIWSSEGQILDANDAFLRIVGYDRKDLVSGLLSWTDFTPPEWADRNAQTVQEVRATGTAQPFEKEYFRKDGSRVPVLIGSASFEQEANQGVAFVLDLTERKQAEEALCASERRHRETQMQLAHANRVATIGQLTASIAHEVNQPIAATVANAQAALRWLGAKPPNLDEVRQTLGRIVRDGDRAGAVVGRIRALIKGAPPRDEHVEINAAIREVIELTHCEAMKNGVSARTELVEDLPVVQGDRVELQQVILNLILNAFEAMSAMGEGRREVLITTGKTESGDLLVAVRDSGPGLAPAALEHLFEAFNTTKPNGLGLGLSICRKIIEGHGGRLSASANAPRGAIFQFTLPAETAAPKPGENEALPTPGRELQTALSFGQSGRVQEGDLAYGRHGRNGNSLLSLNSLL